MKIKVFDKRHFERLEEYLEDEQWQPEIMDELWRQMEECGIFTHTLLVYLLDAAIRAGHVRIRTNMEVYDANDENVLDIYTKAPQNQHEYFDPNPVGLNLMIYCEPDMDKICCSTPATREWTVGGTIVYVDAVEQDEKPHPMSNQGRTKHNWIS